jgi:hypothetical protein
MEILDIYEQLGQMNGVDDETFLGPTIDQHHIFAAAAIKVPASWSTTCLIVSSPRLVPFWSVIGRVRVVYGRRRVLNIVIIRA